MFRWLLEALQNVGKLFFFLLLLGSAGITVAVAASPDLRVSPISWLTVAILGLFTYLAYLVNFKGSSLVSVKTEVNLATESGGWEETDVEPEGGDGDAEDNGVVVQDRHQTGCYECPKCHTVFRGEGFCLIRLLNENGKPPQLVLLKKPNRAIQ